MNASTASVPILTPEQLDSRRVAVESAIGTLRIERLELDAMPNSILGRYAQGEISLDEMSRLIHEYTAKIA